ncbi:hypothetical protein Tco_0641145 [Tanacetum coccineum]
MNGIIWNILVSTEMRIAIEKKLSLIVDNIATDVVEFYQSLTEEMFSNENDRLLREYYYADYMNAILGVYTDIDEYLEMACNYFEALKKCERLKNKLSKRTANVENKSFNKLSKRFSELEKHCISLKLSLQQSQEKIKNDQLWKKHDSPLVSDLNNKTFEIDDLKAQLQDKNIAIDELKKLIEKLKGKSMITKFVKPSVVRQPIAFKSQNPSVLSKPTPFSNSLEKKDFSTSRTKKPIALPFSTREPKQIVIQSEAIAHAKTIALESIIQKPRSTSRRLYENVSKTCSWSHTKLTPPGYKWEPKLKTGNVNTNVSLPLGTEYQSTNLSEPTSVRGSNMSNTPLSSNYFTARRNYHVHRRLWVHKAHEGKSKAFN